MRGRRKAHPPPLLEDLLASIAADTAREEPNDVSDEGETELDYVLDAIRRGQSLGPDVPDGAIADLEDPTIGDVMHDLFDPSFEGVLEALAGREIDDEDFQNRPTAARPRPVPFPAARSHHCPAS